MSALILTGLLFFGIRTPLVLRSADLRKAQLQDADLREANLQNADLSQVELQGAKLWRAQLQGADLREAMVYGTSFQDAELSLADLRGLCLLPVGWKCPSESESPSCEPDQEAFSKIEALEAWLEQEGEHWSEEKREWVARAIDRFWSAALIPFEPVVISPTQGSNIMHDQKGLFAAWPAPPDAAEFEQARADYRAELACTNRYIAKRMRRQAKGNPPLDEGDPALTEALRAKAESGECPELAEVLEKDQ